MADEGSDDGAGQRGPTVADLFFLEPLSTAALVPVVVVAVGVCLLAGFGLFRLEQHYAEAALLTDQHGLAALLARGSSLATTWPGWVAAVFFVYSILRLRSNPDEPPASRTPVEASSVAGLRTGLRQEYRAVRITLVAVTAVAAVDLARFLFLASSASHAVAWARSSLWAALFEVLGWLAAAGLLGVWSWLFHGELERWGAV